MNRLFQGNSVDIAIKIGTLVRERGWTQQEFARRTGLDRATVRQLLRPEGTRRLRNTTLRACADALGVSVHQLRIESVQRLLARSGPNEADAANRQASLWAGQPELVRWLEDHPDERATVAPEEVEELLSMQGHGGPLTYEGVEHFLKQIRRRLRLMEKVQDIAGTEHLDLLEQLVDLLHEKLDPRAARLRAPPRSSP